MIKEIANHRSIRKYKSTPIDEEVLTDILHSAVRASTCGNMQLYSLVVTLDPHLREELAPCHFNQPMVTEAPCLVTVCADIHRFTKWCEQRDADPAYDNFEWFLNAATDALLAAENLALAAEAHGLGICFLGTTLYTARDICRILRLPKGVIPVMTVSVGYPEELPPLTDRLPVEAVVHYEIVVFGIARIEGEVTFVDTNAADTGITVGVVEHFAVDPPVEGVVEGGIAHVGENGFHAAAVFGHSGDFTVATVSVGIVYVVELCTTVEDKQDVVVEEEVKRVSSRFYTQVERQVATAFGYIVVEFVGHDITALYCIVEGFRGIGRTYLYVGLHVLQCTSTEGCLQRDGLRTDVSESQSTRIFTHVGVVGDPGVVDQCGPFGQYPSIFGLFRFGRVAQGDFQSYLYVVDHAHGIVCGFGYDGGLDVVDEQGTSCIFVADAKFHFVLSRQIVGVGGVGFVRSLTVAEFPCAGTRKSRGIGELYGGTRQIVELISFVGDGVGECYVVAGEYIVSGVVLHTSR